MSSIKILRNYFNFCNGLTLSTLSSSVRYLRTSAEHPQSVSSKDTHSSHSSLYQQQKMSKLRVLPLLLPTLQPKAPPEPSLLTSVNNSFTKIIIKTVNESRRGLSTHQMPLSEKQLKPGPPQLSQLMPTRKDISKTSFNQHSMGVLCCALGNSFCLRQHNQ